MSISDKLTVIAENQEKVYDSGYDTGYSSGYIEGRNTMISRSLKSIDDSTLTKVGSYAFAGMVIESINLPKVNTVGKYGFKGCTKLTEIRLPKLKQLSEKGNNTFAYCENVTFYHLPELQIAGSSSSAGQLVSTFEGNFALERLRLRKNIIISTNCFYNCKKLTALILGESNNSINNDSDTELADTTAFKNTPIAGGTGYIYVPDSRVSHYKKKTNWALFASQIKSWSEGMAEGVV